METEGLEAENVKLKEQVSELQKRETARLKSPYPNLEAIDQMSYLEGTKLRFGLVSDTHFGSNRFRLDSLKSMYDLFDKAGVNRVYHSGDITDGTRVYRGQEYELADHGFDAQKDAVVRDYPHLKEGKTFFLQGNHDHSFMKSDGASIGAAIARERKDMVYVGDVERDIKMARGLLLRLRHPDGAAAYASSYKLERYIAGLQPNGKKPNIISSGHFHRAFFMDSRNIFAFETPCFQDQTLFMAAKGLSPVIGGWLVDVIIDKKGSIVRCMPELIKYYA